MIANGYRWPAWLRYFRAVQRQELDVLVILHIDLKFFQQWSQFLVSSACRSRTMLKVVSHQHTKFCNVFCYFDLKTRRSGGIYSLSTVGGQQELFIRLHARIVIHCYTSNFFGLIIQ